LADWPGAEHAADVDAGLLWRLPPHEGIADVDIHLLWNREQKMSPAETVFLESFQHMLSIREPVL